MQDELINKVANSGLITLNLEDFFPTQGIETFDLKNFLFHGLILKEKDFRQALKEYDWNRYENKILCVYCSTDAIIPVWAYMLVTSHAKGKAHEIFTGTSEQYLTNHYNKVISTLNVSMWQDQRIVIKGCSDKPVPASAYADILYKLQDVAQSIMYGEPCSTVPLFKRPRAINP